MGGKHGNAFEVMKQKKRELLQNHHFDVRKETRVKCDAIKKSLGAALEQFQPDEWKPYSYASRFLNEAEPKYSINN